MATGNMTAKLGVKFVEAVQSITNEAAEKLHQASSAVNETQNVQASASVSDYNQWAEWLARLEHPRALEQRAIHENTSHWRTAGEQYISESPNPQNLAYGSTMLREFQPTEYDLVSGLQE
ncbi:hypothetical protein VN97_g3393 [Penicillium thymicola]|uniref:Uncharacterized protein n=1 Tax=Penicillium thymicola TaxID=293382 RepID=A0AAI9TMQ9_PENTH|nr:hypothetical protein VN97_g3393 [Penicillium thymicola]